MLETLTMQFVQKIYRKWLILLSSIILANCPCLTAQSLTYILPADGSTVIGNTQTVSAVTGDTLISLGRRYSSGIIELLEANPTLSLAQTYGPDQKVFVPTQFLLPNAPHKGLVVNLAELRLYFYVPGTHEVRTFPIGVGRQGWDTPLGETYISSKDANPTWVPTEHIKTARLKDGVKLPNSVGPGPDNPLGPYRFRTGLSAILIHGSNDPSGIGRRSSSGCIRMQPEAVESIFNLVPIGLPVTFVDEPVKVGWLGNDLYMEAHIPLEDDPEDDTDTLITYAHRIIDQETQSRPANIDWTLVDQIAKDQHGYPIKIGTGINPIPVITIPLNPSVPVRKNHVHARQKADPNQKHERSKSSNSSKKWK